MGPQLVPCVASGTTENQGHRKVCRVRRRGLRTESRTTDSNHDCVFVQNALIYPKSVPKTAKMSTLKNDLSVLIPGLPARMRPTPLRIHRVTSGPAANSAPTLPASWAKPAARSRAWTTLTTSTTTSTSTQSTFSHRHSPGWECLGCQNQP